MIDYNAGLPAQMAALPRDPHGRPVPWFVGEVNGKPDFRLQGATKLNDALVHGLCWACGRPLGPVAAPIAFVIGPMCAVNRNTAEPPCHRDCAIYCATHCDFLVNPKRGRREYHGAKRKPAGLAIMRNPGVALVWVTATFRMVPDDDHGGGVLLRLGPALETLWFAEGRPATREEVLASIDSGLPILQEMATRQGPDAEAALAQMHQEALEVIPA